MIALLVIVAAFSVSAQNIQSSRKYRVIAYKKGNNGVTSMSNTVEVNPYMSIYIPNTFTPNGDGMNDTFGVYGEAIKEFNIQVYNRWGEMIFETASVDNRWDGTYQGVQVPQGIYVYKVAARGKEGKKLVKDGTVNVIY